MTRCFAEQCELPHGHEGRCDPPPCYLCPVKDKDGAPCYLRDEHSGPHKFESRPTKCS